MWMPVSKENKLQALVASTSPWHKAVLAAHDLSQCPAPRPEANVSPSQSHLIEGEMALTHKD